MEVTLYSTATCPYCKMLKDFLLKNGISYAEKFVDQDEIAKNEMMERSGGFLGVPFTVVKNGDTITSVIGFDKKKLMETFGIKE